MKTVFRTLSTFFVLAVLVVLPRLAFGARSFAAISLSPANTNITAGIATNLTSVLTLLNGSGGSTRYIGPATLTVSVSPSEPTVTASISPSTLTFPASTTTLSATVSVSTVSFTPSNTYVVTITANTNPPNVNVISTNATFTITMGTAAPFDPLMLWTPAGANTNWSTSGNWTPAGPPGAANDARFFDTGATNAAGTVNNVADTSSTVGSVTYGQTNGFHTTLIAAGATLTLAGANGLVAGTGTDNGDPFVTVNTIKGAGGTLVVSNSGAIVKVGQSHPTTGTTVAQAQATLDLSGLDTFRANVSRVLVGVDLPIKGASGVLNLARTNRITATPGSTAPQIDVGDNSQAQSSPAIPSVLLLGQTNVIFADSIATGRGKTDGNGSSIAFNSGFANSVAYFRGTNGIVSRVGSWNIGDGFGSRVNFPNDCHGSNDFSFGTINALVDTMFVGKGASTDIASGANVTGTGTLTFNAGSIDVNTLAIGYSMTVAGFGAVNVGSGGSLLVNTNLELGHGSGSVGTLTASGATVTANAGVIAGGGTAAISLTSSTLNVTNPTATAGTTVAPVTTLAVTNSTLTLAAQNLTPAVSATTLSIGGAANTLNFASVPILTALPVQFPVVQYATADGDLTTFVLGTLPSVAYQGYISNNTANLSLDLVITNGPVVPPLVWDGAISGDWNTTTANWKTNGNPATYQQGYLVVRFDDTLTGTNVVNLTTTLTPGSITVNNSLTNYTFKGAGKISGATGLVKTGTGILTLAETGGNDFSGGITLNDGTLQAGNGGTGGNLGSGSVNVAAPAALVFDRSDNVTVSNVISGSGSLTQNGTNILTLSASNSAFAGQIVVAQGTLKAGSPAALGTVAGGTTVNNNAALDVNGQAFNNTESVTVSGSGVAGGGAIVNSGASQTKVLRNVTLTGHTTFGGNGDWDIHSSANGASDASLSTSGNAWKLTKVNTNTVTLFGAQVDGSLGDIDVLAGSLSVERNTTGLGDSSKTVTVFTNATLQFQNASNIWDKVVVLKDGSTIRGINFDEFAGPVTLESGVVTALTGTGGKLTLDGAVGGSGGLTKTGAGSLVLSSASTYAGPTVISQGTIALINSGTIDGSTNITLSAGTTLDLSALSSPTLTVTTGRGMAGSGTVIGSVTMATGSTLTVGGPGTNTLGTLTVTNTLVLQSGSTSLMEVSKAGGVTNNDQVVATNLTYGGTLTVTGTGGAFVSGDTFKLFSAGSYGSSFNVINLPTNVVWNTTQLGANGTIQVVSVSKPHISGAMNTATNFQVTFSGPAGNSYRVWASTNVAASPITNTWTVVASGVINATGTVTVTDNTAVNYPVRFYRISVP